MMPHFSLSSPSLLSSCSAYRLNPLLLSKRCRCIKLSQWNFSRIISRFFAGSDMVNWSPSLQTVVSDLYVDKDFGTGVLKISPGHDHNDCLLARKLGLPILNVMNKDGTLNEVAGLYCGLDRFEARKKLWSDLEETSFAVKKEPDASRVPRFQPGGALKITSVKSSRFLVAKFIHSEIKARSNETVNAICDHLRRGWNWDTLSRKFGSVELNDSVVEKVLLELKEPTDAKQALGFFHWSTQRKGFEHGIWSYCLTIHILVRARLLMDARALLESILKKSMGYCSRLSVVDSLLRSYKIIVSNPLVFDLLVQAYAKMRMFEIGFDVCCYLEEHGFSLSIISFNTLIHVVQKSDQYPLTWKIYVLMIRQRTYPNEVTIRIMINALCKEGKLQTFVDILDRIHGKRCSPSVIVNTSLIFRMMEEEKIEEGMVLLKRILQKNMILDTIAYSLIVFAKVKLKNLDSAWEVYEEMLKRGFNANSFVYTSFIGAYCREGRIEKANHLFEEMEDMGLKPYDETFNLLIEGFAKAGSLEGSLSQCEKMMERGLVPSCLAFNEMAKKLCEIGDVKRANAMLTIMLDKGFIPNEITYSHLISGFGKEGEVKEVLMLYYEMEYRSLSPKLLVFTSLIRSLCQCGKVEEAEKYLKIMKDRSLAPSENIYEALITCHFEKGDKTRALQLYNDMVSRGLKPNCSSFF